MRNFLHHNHLILYLVLAIVAFLIFPSDYHVEHGFSEGTRCAHAFFKSKKKKTYEEYIEFFEEVYQTMVDNYYQEISRDVFDEFVEKFKNKIYVQLKDTGKSVDYIRWRSTHLLVEHLKTSEDIFSEFYPPKPAKKYEKTVLGVRKDLGIDGELIDKGYVLTQVEPRSDAYVKGLRIDDLIIRIDQDLVVDLNLEQIKEKLTPFVDTVVSIRYLSAMDLSEKNIEVKPTEFFRQSVFMMPQYFPGIYGIEIKRFNRKTAEDIFRFMKYFRKQGEIKGLILDLRGNPGGPPLAARELSSFFLEGGDDFAFFQKRGHPKSLLDVPNIPGEFKYEGPLVILIDEGSGSASELFSGIMQRKGRAVLMGQNSAGQVFLKSMFPLKDKSMLLLITGRGYHSDGAVFSFGGVVPNRYVDDEDDALKHAMTYLVYSNQKK